MYSIVAVWLIFVMSTGEVSIAKDRVVKETNERKLSEIKEPRNAKFAQIEKKD